MEETGILFFSENNFQVQDEELLRSWLKNVISSEEKRTGEINYIFCNDDFLLEMNQKYLNHDTYTDIISFDNSVGNILNGDIYISTERVAENAVTFEVAFNDELKRVLVHGILHLCRYKDKTEEEKALMRQKEDEKIKMFHVEQ